MSKWDKEKEEKFQKRLTKLGKRIPKLGSLLKYMNQLDADINIDTQEFLKKMDDLRKKYPGEYT